MAFMNASRKRPARRNVAHVNRDRKDGARSWWASLDWGKVRFGIVGVLFALVWGALWVRAGYVQLWQGPYLAERARRQHMSAELVASPRSEILDRNG